MLLSYFPFYQSLYILYHSKFAKGRFHINLIQKTFENLYLNLDSSDFKSVFRLNEKEFKLENIFSNFLLKKKKKKKKNAYFTQNQFSEIS